MMCVSQACLVARERGRQPAGKRPSLPTKTGEWRRWRAQISCPQPLSKQEGQEELTIPAWLNTMFSVRAFSPFSHLVAGDWAPFILCQDFGFCCSWFPSYAWGVGRKQSTEPEQWVQRALGHMTTPTSSPTLPCLSFPLCYQNVKSLLLLLPGKLSAIPNMERCDL